MSHGFKRDLRRDNPYVVEEEAFPSNGNDIEQIPWPRVVNIGRPFDPAILDSAKWA